MENKYETSSKKYSRGYAEPESRYNENNSYGYKDSRQGRYSDSLESQFFYDRPAANLGRSEPSQQSFDNVAYDDYNNYQTNNYRQADYQERDYDQSYNNGYTMGQTHKGYDYQAEREENLNARYQDTNYNNYEQYNDNQMRYTDTIDDTRPSATTGQFLDDPVLNENPMADMRDNGLKKQYTINTKAKVLIAVYALVVVTVFALIILNTRLLKNMNSAIASKEVQIVRLSQEVDSLKETLDYVSSDEVINQKAQESGMVKG